MSNQENDTLIEDSIDATVDKLLEIVTESYNEEVGYLISYSDWLDTIIYELEGELANLKGQDEERRIGDTNE